MTISLYFGLFMLVSGGIFAMIGKMLFVRETNTHQKKQEQDLEIPRRFIKTGFLGMMLGLLLIAIYLLDYYFIMP